MPGVPFEDTGCRVIAGDGKDVRFFSQQNRERGVQFGNSVAFGGEVAVLALHVGVFEMDEKEIVIAVFAKVALKLLSDVLRPFKFAHADKLRETLIHRIHSKAAGAQSISISESRDCGLMRDASKKKAIRGRFF